MDPLQTAFCYLNFESLFEHHLYFQMQSPSCKEIREDNHCKIFFPEKVFGKATKNRREDPNMFDLLSWGSDGFQKHSFKKDQKFRQPCEAYLNMIGKNHWTSETQENYVNYHQNCIQANPDVLNKIQNYISQRQPQSTKAEKKSPQKSMKKGGEKKNGVVQKDEKKQNKYMANNYLSPKAMSRKHIDIDNQDKFRRSSSGQHPKQSKKLKIKDQTKYQNTHKQLMNKTFGQQLERNKHQQKQFTQHQQQKLIEHFKQTTRWIPNSAFTTYFGKPPFENYGRGNTHPIDGGLVYGTYLYSHNVHPHRGKNQPKYVQSYPVALMKAKSQGTLIPAVPRTKPDFATDYSKAGGPQKDHKARIEPQMNNFVGTLKIQRPNLTEIQKFGGKRGLRTAQQLKNVE